MNLTATPTLREALLAIAAIDEANDHERALVLELEHGIDERTKERHAMMAIAVPYFANLDPATVVAVDDLLFRAVLSQSRTLVVPVDVIPVEQLEPSTTPALIDDDAARARRAVAAVRPWRFFGQSHPVGPHVAVFPEPA